LHRLSIMLFPKEDVYDAPDSRIYYRLADTRCLTHMLILDVFHTLTTVNKS
jgi:hypothetical protein